MNKLYRVFTVKDNNTNNDNIYYQNYYDALARAKKIFFAPINSDVVIITSVNDNFYYSGEGYKTWVEGIEPHELFVGIEMITKENCYD